MDLQKIDGDKILNVLDCVDDIPIEGIQSDSIQEELLIITESLVKRINK